MLFKFYLKNIIRFLLRLYRRYAIIFNCESVPVQAKNKARLKHITTVE